MGVYPSEAGADAERRQMQLADEVLSGSGWVLTPPLIECMPIA